MKWKFKQKRSKSDKKDDVLRDNYDDQIESEVIDDAPKKSSRLELIFNMFKFDSHRKIERFMFQLFTAVGVTILGLGIILYHNYRVSQQQSQTLTSLSSNVIFSKSGAAMALANLVASPSGKTVYLPIKFGDMTQLPGSADHFSLFLSATDGSLKYRPYGQILVYGVTGYGMIIFHSETGFKNQPVTVYLKNNVNFTGNALGNTQSDSDLASIQKKYDVAIFKLNLAAKNVQTIKQLPDGNAKPDLLYNYIIGNVQRKNVMKKIKADQSGISNDNSISESLYQQLTERGYEMPTPPTFVTSSKWRPFNQVNPETGQVGNSKHYVNADGSSSFTAKQKLKFPSALSRKSGNKLVKMNINSVNGASPDVQSWQKLQSLWTDIYNRKYDMYVTQYAKLFAITQKVFQNGSSYSVSAPANFTLLGDVSVH